MENPFYTVFFHIRFTFHTRVTKSHLRLLRRGSDLVRSVGKTYKIIINSHLVLTHHGQQIWHQLNLIWGHPWPLLVFQYLECSYTHTHHQNKADTDVDWSYIPRYKQQIISIYTYISMDIKSEQGRYRTLVIYHYICQNSWKHSHQQFLHYIYNIFRIYCHILLIQWSCMLSNLYKDKRYLLCCVQEYGSRKF